MDDLLYRYKLIDQQHVSKSTELQSFVCLTKCLTMTKMLSIYQFGSCHFISYKAESRCQKSSAESYTDAPISLTKQFFFPQLTQSCLFAVNEPRFSPDINHNSEVNMIQERVQKSFSADHGLHGVVDICAFQAIQ